MNELVSVIVPMYNAEKTIITCLDSVKNQNYTGDFELLIINDGSTDNSKLLVENYIKQNSTLVIHLFSQENKGVSSARNVGLKAAKGDYIAFLDSDDVWLPNKTKTQINILLDEPDIDFLACCRTNQIPKFPYQTNQDMMATITFRKLLFRNEAQPSSVVFRSKILNRTGYFRKSQRYAEDIHFWLKISRNFTMFICSHQLLLADNGKRTFGVSGLSGDLNKMHKGHLSNLKFCLKRRWINRIEYWLLYLFYKLKYAFLVLRSL